MVSLKVLLIVSGLALVGYQIGVLSTIAHGNERFVSGFEDLPLMPAGGAEGRRNPDDRLFTRWRLFSNPVFLRATLNLNAND